jgi:PAS domain S-box-containing protein
MTRRVLTIVRGVLLFSLLAILPRGLAQETVVLQLKWHHQFQFAGYYAADAKGFYEDAGFQVEFREGENVDTVDEVLSGRADFGIALSDLVLRYAGGEPVVALATVYQHSPLVLLRRGGASAGSVHDLNGARVMMEEHSVELEAYLDQMGVDPALLVKIPYENAVDALLAGEVDAISAYLTDEPFVMQQKQMSYHVYTPRAAGIDFYGDTLFASRERTLRSPDSVERFVQASLKGWRYALSHPEEIIEVILERYPQRNTREALEYEARMMADLIRADLVEVGYMNPERWQYIADVYQDRGVLPEPIQLQGFLYKTPVRVPWKDALLILGPLGTVLLLSWMAIGYQFRLRKLNQVHLEEMEEAKRKMTTLVGNLPGMAYRCENDQGCWVMRYISPGVKRLTGYSPEEFLSNEGKVFGDLIHPDDAASVVEEVESSILEDRRYKMEYRLQHRDGTYRWVWEQGSVIKEGEEAGLLEGFICGIDEEKKLRLEKQQAMEELQKAMSELKQLQGIIPVCSNCHQVRNDAGGWEMMEIYIRNHTSADFSHGICPACLTKLYPDLYPDRASADPETEASDR